MVTMPYSISDLIRGLFSNSADSAQSLGRKFLPVPVAAKPAVIWKNKQDAPREKLMLKGVEYLSDSELLAIFLRVGYKGKNVIELAEDVIADKGLSWLIQANRKEFCSYKGLGVSHYVQLRAVMELARRYLEDVMLRKSEALTSPNRIREFLCHHLGDRRREVFGCIFMDNKNRVIEYKEIFSGTIDSTIVFPREIMRIALELNAVCLILVHNHPSGSVRPSTGDKKVTKLIQDACEIMDMKLLDHIIVSGNRSLSFMEEGLLKE